MYHQRYMLATPAIANALAKVEEVIRYRCPGMLMYALTRYGKTYAIRFMNAMLKRKMPGLFTLIFECRENVTPKPAIFYTQLLHCLGHDSTLKGNAPDKEVRLLNKLLEEAQKSGFPFVVMFADEAQNLTVDEFKWLTTISNVLSDKGCRLITFLVGQPQLQHRKSALIRAGETQIVGRFMVEEYQFRGIRSEEDLAACLKAYDFDKFPINSDWSYTRFCMPSQWAQGFRAVHQAEVLWGEFLRVFSHARKGGTLEIPMSYFTRAVEYQFLFKGLDNVSGEAECSADGWREAVARSNFEAGIGDILEASSTTFQTEEIYSRPNRKR